MEFDVEKIWYDGDIPENIYLEINENLTVDARNAVNWSGRFSIVLHARDSAGLENSSRINITVENVNDPPEIRSIPPEEAIAGKEYSYKIDAVDSDSERISCKVEGPEGMKVEDMEVKWLPSEKDANKEHPITLTVSDGQGYTVQKWKVRVKPKNNPPVIISSPPQRASADRVYEYTVIARDDDGDSLTLKLLEAPEGMHCDNMKIEWKPSKNDVGIYRISIAVSDGLDIVFQNFTLSVIKNHAPEFLTEKLEDAVVGVKYTFKVEVYDRDGDEVRYELLECPDGMTINENGEIEYYPYNEGKYEMKENMRL